MKSLDIRTEAEAFCYFAISRILRIDHDEIRSSITDGGDDRGIDAIYIDGRPEKRTIHIFQFKHVGKFERSVANFPSNEIDKIISFISNVLSKDETLDMTCNSHLWEKICDIWNAMEEAVHSIEVHLCSNTAPLVTSQAARLEEALKPYGRASFTEHDLSWFSRELTKGTSVSRDFTLPLVEDHYFSRSDGFANGLIGTVRGEEIVNLIANPRFPSEVDESLFEENIRVYLGEQNEVNRKILFTASSQENSKFWYLNNGITIVCDRMEFQPRATSPKVRMTNPQIVNGGQTSYALFEAARPDPALIRHVKLLVRIIETADRSFTNSVAEATNSQTPIRSRDIRSNDLIQIKLENSLRAHGYYYERKHDQHVEQPAEVRIDSGKLGQIILAYLRQEPDRAKTASNKIFGEYYEMVFDESVLSAKNVIAMWQIYRMIDDDRRRALAEANSRTNGPYDEAWIIEGVFHVLFMLARQCELKGIDPFDVPKVAAEYASVKNALEEFVRANGTKASYRIFRSAMTKRLLAQGLASKQMSFGF